MAKKILVTGGAGFIGSHLCERLLSDGNEIICLDNMSTGREVSINKLKENDKFSFVHHDVVEPYDFEVDQIYNLACPASPVHYQKDPVSTIRTSVIGSSNALDLAQKLGVRILQTSTSEVYGDPEVNPQPETYLGNVNPIGRRACYDEGKRCAETLFFDYHREYGTDIRVVRIFNTYGPHMTESDGRVISNFVVQALAGDDITIYGDGTQTRSFCYVDDMVDGIVAMMENDNFIGPVNLGNPVERTIADVAEKIIAATDSKSKIVYKPLPSDDPKQRRPDITLAFDKLGWKPKIDFEAGLAKTVEYFKNYPD